MARKVIDYSKSLVYRIAYKDTTYYVGSTTNFRNRKNSHKSSCKNEKSSSYNKPLYVFIRENGGWSDEWVMVLVQYYPDCKTSIELRKYEREHYDIYNPELNVCKPCLKEGENEEYQKEYKKEYQQENADKIKEYQKEYRKENDEKLKVYKKEYQQENADKIKEYRKENADKIKEYQKEYRKENDEKIKEYRKENADKNKEYNKVYQKENAEKQKEKHTCECGGIHRKSDSVQHKKTQKHIKYVESQKNEVIITL